MMHPIYRVRSFEIVAPYTLRVEFDDNTVQTINFQPVLAGELYGPLRDLSLFNQVQLDPEVHTLVWPNGADFDPATLHDWPERVQGLTARAQHWTLTATTDTMDEKPTWLIEKEISLDNGSKAQWSYDTESDMLEVFFKEGHASCTVELADGVYLRLDLDKRQPLSIAFLAVSSLTRYGEFGPFLLQLDGLESLSDDLRQIVTQVITSPPVSSVLKVFSYSSSPQTRKQTPLAWLPHQLATE